MSNQSDGDSASQDRARLLVGIVSVLLLIAFAVTGLVVDEGRGQSPARVKVMSVAVETIGKDTHVATVGVENLGDITAEAVVVRVEVEGEDPIDRDIDFLAPAESDEITFVLPSEIQESDVDADVKGWTSAR